MDLKLKGHVNASRYFTHTHNMHTHVRMRKEQRKRQNKRGENVPMILDFLAHSSLS